jgi:hypothetical protein
MRVVSQLVTIYGDPSVCLYTPLIQGFSVNMSLTQFTRVDVVISSASVGNSLPPNGQVILPACFWVITALKWVKPFTTQFRVNTAHVWVNKSTTHVWVNKFTAHVWVNMFTARLWMNTAFKWVNPFAAHVWVAEFVDHSMFMLPFAADVLTFEHVNYCGACEQLDETARHQIILSQALVNEFMLQVPVTEFAVMAGSMDYTTTGVNTLMRELFDLMCLQSCYATMHLLPGGPIFMESQDMIQRASTMKYDIMDYPFFLLHQKHNNFLSFGQSLKLYTYYLSQYRLVRVLEFLICWVTHLDQF